MNNHKQDNFISDLDRMLERSRVSAEPDENFAADLKNKLASLHLDNISNTAAMNTNSNTEVAGDSASQSTKSRFNLKFALSFASLAILALVVGGIFFFSKNGSEDSIQVDDQYFAEVVFIEGDVQVGEKDGDSVQFSDISSGKSVAQGDVIRTFADSRAIIQLDDGSALRLNENTKLALDSLDPNSILVTNLEGEVFARVIKAERDFVVASDSLNLSSLGTAYKSVNKEKEEGVVVYESAVKFKKKESDDSKEVQEGKQLYIKSETKEIDTILDLTSEEVKVDDFALWNKKKDEENDEYKNKLGFFSN
ncbi:MAG TPA: FecR domain-containing protein, partial [Candidatus Dojkabacteria bacterium]